MNKPCPFDKSSMHVLSVTKCKGIYGFMIYRVFCTCGASGPWKNFPEEAWTAWNTRPGEDELQAKLEAQSEQVQREWASPLEVAQFKDKYAAAMEVCRELVATAIKDQPLKLRYHIEFADGTVYYPANTIDPIADKARKVVEG